MDRSRTLESLKHRLGAIVGAKGCLDQAGALLAYECDGLALLRQRPQLVLLPRDTNETVECMRLLHQAGLPVVARGAGTGLSGGATPVAGGVLIAMTRSSKILELDPIDRIARVQAGVINIDLSLAAARHGLYYAPDPSSQQACTLGGNVAENSGGPHCLMHGSTAQHVLGLTIVMHDGTLLDLSRPRLDPEQLDLVGCFVGSEGTFGLATELTLKLTRKPAAVCTILAIYRDLDGACDSVSDIIAARLEPAALEILDRLTIEAVEKSVFSAGYPKDAEAVLLVEVEGSAAEVASSVARIEPILRERGAFELRTAEDDSKRKQLWAGRKGAFGAMGRIAPDLYVADVVVPRTKLRDLVRRVTEIAREKRLKLANVFQKFSLPTVTMNALICLRGKTFNCFFFTLSVC